LNPDLIILFVAFSLFGIELIFLKIKKREISLDQTVLNLGLGMIERLIGILTINFGLYFFTFLIPWRFIDPFGPPVNIPEPGRGDRCFGIKCGKSV